MPKITPRPYQKEAIDRVMEELDFHTKIMLESSVSSGKTIMILDLANRLATQYNVGVVIGLTFSSLVDQFIETAKDMEIEVCVLKSGYNRAKDAKIQIVMEQSAITKLNDLIEADVYLLEEAHVRVGSSRYTSIKNHIKPRYEVGFSGTPYDARGLAIEGFHNVKGVSHQDCEDMGYLTPLRFIRTNNCTIDTRTVASSGSDFSVEDLDAKVDGLLDNIIDHMKMIEDEVDFSFSNDTSIWFCPSTEEADKVAAKLQEAGYPIYPYHSKSKNNEAVMEAFRTQRPIREDLGLFDGQYEPKYVRGLVSVMSLSIGFSVSHVSMAIALRVSKVRAKDVQQIGRSCRKHTPLDDLLEKIKRIKE